VKKITDCFGVADICIFRETTSELSMGLPVKGEVLSTISWGNHSKDDLLSDIREWEIESYTCFLVRHFTSR
jgi:hypothetical protein